VTVTDAEVQNLLAALDVRNEPTENRRFSKEVAEARRKEKTRRNAQAQGRALQALARIHPDEYDILYAEAKRRVDTERGPLPGDDEQ
jgi:hypothetical protein